MLDDSCPKFDSCSVRIVDCFAISARKKKKNEQRQKKNGNQLGILICNSHMRKYKTLVFGFMDPKCYSKTILFNVKLNSSFSILSIAFESPNFFRIYLIL